MKLVWNIAVKAVTFLLLAVCGTKMIFDSTNWVLTVFVGFITVVSFPLCTLLHELGHILFGAAVKVKAVPDSKNFFTFIKETFLNWWDASSCKIIPKSEEGLRGRMIFTAAGGVAVNAGDLHKAGHRVAHKAQYIAQRDGDGVPHLRRRAAAQLYQRGGGHGGRRGSGARQPHR